LTAGASIRGRLFAVGAGVAFGTQGPLGKLFYDHGGAPFELLVMRIVGVALVFGVLMGMRRRRLRRRAVLLAIGFGAFQAGASYALFEGYAKAPVALVVLLFYIYPFLATVGGALLFKEEFGLGRLAVLALGIVGIALTVGTPSSAPALGIALGLIAGVCTAAYVLAARGLMTDSLEPIELIGLAFAGQAIAFLVAAKVRGFKMPSATAFGYASGVVLVGGVAALLLFYAAVRLVGAGTTSLLASVEPLVSVGLAYVVLDESLKSTQLVGGALILSAVAALAVGRRGRGSEAVPVTHS
jgi:drug/metabolite transporter (DMT)-like permease